MRVCAFVHAVHNGNEVKNQMCEESGDGML